jgi:hypothetical protein
MTINRGTVATDARNRAARTFIQGLAVDVVAALTILLLPVVTSAEGWGDFQWSLLGFLAAKTVAATVLAYLMRAYIDPYRAIRSEIRHSKGGTSS